MAAAVMKPVDAKNSSSNMVANSAGLERPGLTKDEIAELKEAFDLFDTEGSGRIDVNELKGAMQALGYNKKNKMVFAMIEQLKDGTTLDFSSFLDLMTAKMGDDDSEAELLKVFDLFDEEGKGAITVQCLSRVAKEVGENMTPAELKEMIERADEDGDGVINRSEFVTLMTRKSGD